MGFRSCVRTFSPHPSSPIQRPTPIAHRQACNGSSPAVASLVIVITPNFTFDRLCIEWVGVLDIDLVFVGLDYPGARLECLRLSFFINEDFRRKGSHI